MAFTPSRKRHKARLPRRFSARQTVINLVGAGVLLLLCLSQLETAILEQFAFADTSTSGFFNRRQTNPQALYQEGINQYLNNGNSTQALAYLTRALNNFSNYIPAFLRKGEILADMGNLEQARAISTYIDSIAPDNSQWRWDRTMLAYMLGQEKILARNLTWFVRENSGKRREALALSTSLWPDPAQLSRHITSANMPHALDYFIGISALEKAQATWQVIVENHLQKASDTLGYTNFLIRNNKIPAARDVWQYVVLPENDSMAPAQIFNRRFNNKIIGSGFGWRVSERHEYLLNNADDMLHLLFNGHDNLEFSLHQLIPVTPTATYRFFFRQKSHSLTTNEKPFWSVQEYQCDKLRERTESVPEDSDWHQVSLTFTVPENCQAIWIALRRKKSFHFDNKISGEYWAKDLVLRESETSSQVPKNHSFGHAPPRNPEVFDQALPQRKQKGSTGPDRRTGQAYTQNRLAERQTPWPVKPLPAPLFLSSPVVHAEHPGVAEQAPRSRT